MISETLELFLYGEAIGQMRPYRNAGSVSFTYHPEYKLDKTPLSLSMLDHTSSYRREFRRFLLNLRTDDDAKLSQLARDFSFSSGNLYMYFATLGLDCAGALQFVKPEDINIIKHRRDELVAISEKEIEKRLFEVRTNPSDSGIRSGEHISLPGYQSKFALHNKDGKWYRALGDIPTTHILKPGIQNLKHQSLNEFLCMKVACKLGLDSEQVHYAHFGDEPALVATRYDRRMDENGEIVRLHQEDMCQALSVIPEQKYEAEKGPTAADIVKLLDKHSLNIDRENNITNFIRALFFQYFIGAPDGHAKNYSLLLDGQSVKLAPLYDIASTFDTDCKTLSGGVYRLAMNIGGCRDFGALCGGNIAKFAKRAEVDETKVRGIAIELATNIPDAVRDVLREHKTIPACKYFEVPFQKWTAKLSKLFFDNIDIMTTKSSKSAVDEIHMQEVSFDTVSK